MLLVKAEAGISVHPMRNPVYSLDDVEDPCTRPSFSAAEHVYSLSSRDGKEYPQALASKITKKTEPTP